MAKWHPTDDIEVVSTLVEAVEFQLALEEIARIVYKGLCRTSPKPTIAESPDEQSVIGDSEK